MNSFLDKLFRWLRFRGIIKQIPKNSIVCDIGCGSDAYFLKKISNFIKYGIGLDKKVKSYQGQKIELREINLSKTIPLESEKFNIVTMIAVSEHLEYPQEILNESFRILKKGGKLIITTPTPLAKPILETLSFKFRLIDKDEIKDHKNYFWPKEVKQMLLGAKFKEENMKSYFFNIYLNSLIIAQK